MRTQSLRLDEQLHRDDGPRAVAPPERAIGKEPQKSWRIRDHGLRAATVIAVVLLHAGLRLSVADTSALIFFSGLAAI
jgi:hypothetical protein